MSTKNLSEIEAAVAVEMIMNAVKKYTIENQKLFIKEMSKALDELKTTPLKGKQ